MDSDPAPGSQARGFLFELRENNGRLELIALHHPGYGAVWADWTGSEIRRRIAAGRRQLLARAVGLHKAPQLRVLDATAGLGRDGYTLAALGAQVTLLERNAMVGALLADARRRALNDAAAAQAAARTEVVVADARTLLERAAPYDAIYLDPMYPDLGKTALAKKEMQLLRELTGGDADADDLLAPALANAKRRVVVKRPVKAPPLSGQKPQLCLRGTQARFDIYLVKSEG
jgi:16S rRNA (guanine1516-N2)-methyltransferase